MNREQGTRLISRTKAFAGLWGTFRKNENKIGSRLIIGRGTCKLFEREKEITVLNVGSNTEKNGKQSLSQKRSR